MTYVDMQQQNPWYGYNPQQAWGNPQSQFHGIWPGAAQLGMGAFGYGSNWGGQPWAQQAWGQQQPWGQQRQLSQHDVGEVIRQLLPALPQILAQTQQQPGLGYAAYGNMPRTLTQQDVNDVVRQLLPLVPQIVGALQGQPHQQFAMHGGLGGLGQNFGAQNPFGMQSPFQQSSLFQQPSFQQPLFQQTWGAQQPWGAQYGQFGASPFLQPAFGGQQWNPAQRQLSQHDVAEVTRQLVGLIPQVIGNLQSINQQRMM